MKANLIDFTFVYPDIQNCEKKEERLWYAWSWNFQKQKANVVY